MAEPPEAWGPEAQLQRRRGNNKARSQGRRNAGMPRELAAIRASPASRESVSAVCAVRLLQRIFSIFARAAAVILLLHVGKERVEHLALEFIAPELIPGAGAVELFPGRLLHGSHPGLAGGRGKNLGREQNEQFLAVSRGRALAEEVTQHRNVPQHGD